MIVEWGPVANWVAERLPGTPEFGNHQSLVVRDGVRIVAGVVFHDWQPESGTIELSVAAENRRWATREAFKAVFGYAFSFCRMIVVRTSGENSPALKFWRALGADEYRIKDLNAPGVDLIIHTLTKEQWENSRIGKRCCDGR